MVAYKPHHACFNCCKTFKRRLMGDIKKGEQSTFEAKCPECGELMANMGLDFESPKKDDVKNGNILKAYILLELLFILADATARDIFLIQKKN